MKIIPFPKDRWTGGPPARSEPDDFEQEIERTRRNERLMMMLEARAIHSAAVSLEEIKQQLANDGPSTQRHKENIGSATLHRPVR